MPHVVVAAAAAAVVVVVVVVNMVFLFEVVKFSQNCWCRLKSSGM
jgi:hypothetical protein